MFVLQTIFPYFFHIIIQEDFCFFLITFAKLASVVLNQFQPGTTYTVRKRCINGFFQNLNRFIDLGKTGSDPKLPAGRKHPQC